MRDTLTSTMSEEPFKQCPKCHFVWERLADFLKDDDLRFIGRQKGVSDDVGLIIFTHTCGTTLAIEAQKSIGSFAAEGRQARSDLEDARLQCSGRRKISVLLVDDHRILRQGLASLLQFEEEIEVVGEAENGQQAVELAHRYAPVVIIMDVNMPVMNGIEATRILAKELPQIKVIALSMHAERHTAEAMRQAGAVAYLTKGAPSEDLIAAIRTCG